MVEKPPEKLPEPYKYKQPLPKDPAKVTEWLLDINEEFFIQELSNAVSTPFTILPMCSYQLKTVELKVIETESAPHHIAISVFQC